MHVSQFIINNMYECVLVYTCMSIIILPVSQILMFSVFEEMISYIFYNDATMRSRGDLNSGNIS